MISEFKKPTFSIKSYVRVDMPNDQGYAFLAHQGMQKEIIL